MPGLAGERGWGEKKGKRKAFTHKENDLEMKVEQQLNTAVCVITQTSHRHRDDTVTVKGEKYILYPL